MISLDLQVQLCLALEHHHCSATTEVLQIWRCGKRCCSDVDIRLVQQARLRQLLGRAGSAAMLLRRTL